MTSGPTLTSSVVRDSSGCSLMPQILSGQIVVAASGALSSFDENLHDAVRPFKIRPPMIQNRVVSWIDFRHLVTSPAPGRLGKPLDDDPDQEAAVAAPVNQSLQLIAGPGTGKTTSL